MKQITYYLLIFFSLSLIDVFSASLVVAADVGIENNDNHNHEQNHKQTGAEFLGDLFINRKLRDLLHQRRKKYSDGDFSDSRTAIATSVDTANTLESPVASKLSVLKMRGLVLRADGQHTVWLNNGNTFSGYNQKQEIKVELDYINRQKLQIPVTINGQKIIMKPGQIWRDKEIHTEITASKEKN